VTPSHLSLALALVVSASSLPSPTPVSLGPSQSPALSTNYRHFATSSPYLPVALPESSSQPTPATQSPHQQHLLHDPDSSSSPQANRYCSRTARTACLNPIKSVFNLSQNRHRGIHLPSEVLHGAPTAVGLSDRHRLSLCSSSMSSNIRHLS
jgi:hypothetical protein